LLTVGPKSKNKLKSNAIRLRGGEEAESQEVVDDTAGRGRRTVVMQEQTRVE